MRRQFSFWTVAATLGLFLFAAAAPSPLYGMYAARWQFSALTLTEVFAVYAVALLVALLLTGSLSDFAGRRPVILGAIAIELASMLTFVAASDVKWLFVARITQGVATGLVTSALAAALVDLQPSGRQQPLAPLVNAATPIAGLAAGALVSATVVQYLPDPLHLVYWLIVAGLVVLGAATFRMPEPAQKKPGFSLVPRIGVEAGLRTQFVASLPSLIAGWAVGGFYLSLGPSLILQLGSSTNRLLGGSTITVLGGVGAVAIIALQTWAPRRTMIVGGAAMTTGLAIAVVAVSTTSVGLFFVSTAVTGVGFGIGWLGVLRSLVALAAPTARAALLAAIFMIAYLSFAIPAVIAGYMVTRIGFHEAAFLYAAAMDVLAVAGLTGALLVRPRPTAELSRLRPSRESPHDS